MKRNFLTLTLLLAFAAATISPLLAQDSAMPRPDAEKPKVEKPDKKVTSTGDDKTSDTASDPMSGIFGSGFQKLTCTEFSSTPDGQIHISGSVDLKMEQMQITCNALNIDQEKKIMTAIGTPVKIDQGDTKSQCNKFTYYIDEKRSVLEQNPLIYQKQGDKTMKTKADIITVTQGKDGKPSMHFGTDPKNPGGVVIEQTGGDTKKTDDTAKKGSAQKVETGPSLNMIKIPSPAQ